MGASQSLDAGYACVSGELSEVDKQHIVTQTFLQKQAARAHGRKGLLRCIMCMSAQCT